MRIKSIFILLSVIYFWHSKAQCTITGKRIVCLKSLNSFSISTTGTVSSYAWDLGNGNNSSSPSPSVVYTSTGNYTITCTITFSNGNTCKDTHRIEVKALPQAKFGILQSDTCLFGNFLCLGNLSQPATTGGNLTKALYIWDDGDNTLINNPAINQKSCHVYSDSGLYKVTLEITDQYGCVNDIVRKIHILPDIKSRITASISSSCGKGVLCVTSKTDSMGLKNNQYFWNIDGFKSTKNGISTVCTTYINQSKMANIKLISVNKFGCRDTFVLDTFVFGDTISNKLFVDTAICLSDNSPRTASTFAYPNATYTWYINGIKLSGAKTNELKFVPSVINSEPGYGEITVEINFPPCYKQIKKKIRIKGPKIEMKIYNKLQCYDLDSHRYVFGVDKTKYTSNNRINRLWFFDDPLGTKCTTYLKKLDSSCIYNQNKIAKYKFITAGDYNVILYIYDSATKCEDYKIESVKLKYCPIDLNKYKKLSLCVGSTFFKVNPPDLFLQLPILFTLDTGKTWRKFPGLTTAKDLGLRKAGFIFKNRRDTTAFGNNDSFYLKKDSVFYDTVWIKDFVEVFNISTSIKLKSYTISSKCDTCYNVIKSTTGRITFNGSLSIKGTLSDTIIKINDTFPFDSFIYKTKFLNSAMIKISFCTKDGACCAVITPTPECGASYQKINDRFSCWNKPVQFNAKIKNINDTVFWVAGAKNRKVYWQFLDTPPTIDSGFKITKSFKAGGRKPYRIKVIDQFGCSSDFKDTIDISEIDAGIKYFKSPLVCSQIIQFFDSSKFIGNKKIDSIKTNIWTFDKAARTSFLKNPALRFFRGGNIKIVHTVISKNGCVDTISRYVKIIGPEPFFSILSDTIGCEALTVKFKNNSNNTPKYIWLFGDKDSTTYSTTSDTNVQFTYKKAGRYYPKLIGNGDFYNPTTGNNYFCTTIYPGDPPFDSLRISVLVKPWYKPSILAPDSLCINEKFIAQTVKKFQHTNINWIFGDGSNYKSDTGYFASHSYKNTGIYDLQIFPKYNVLKDSMCVDSASKKIIVLNVNADFTMDLSNSPFVKFNNTSVGATKYYWNFGDPASGSNNASTLENPTHEFTEPYKEYEVCLIAENDLLCADTICKKITPPANEYLFIANVFTPGNSDSKNDDFDVKIYGEKYYHLRIWNRWGQLMYESKKDGLTGDKINWNGLVHNTGSACPEGTYFYQFTYEFYSKPGKKDIHGTIVLLRK